VSVLGRPKKWPSWSTYMTVYVPVELKEELATRAAVRHMSLSEYTVSLILRGLDAEKAEEAERGGKTKEAQ